MERGRLADNVNERNSSGRAGSWGGNEMALWETADSDEWALRRREYMPGTE